MRQWSKRCNSLEGRIHQLEQEKEQLRQVHEEHMAMEINIANDTRGLQQQLATANERNQELQDQVTKFRDIILKKVSDQPQATPDSTIIGTFVDLRVKIQHIVLKFCQCNLQPRHIKSSSLPEQREFFAIWNTGLSIHQLQNRARGKIFELLGQNILCAAIFGLDDVDKSGRLEAELAQFEVYLNSIRRGTTTVSSLKFDSNANTYPGHEADISDWRTQTLKCASFCQGPPSQQPQRVAQHIIDFMTPVLPRREKAEEKYVEPCNHTLQLCTTAFKLTLLLRGCKDLYRCEIPVRGGEFVEEEADEQDSEAVSGKGPPRAKKIAFAMSGTLVKYTEHKDRIVLEKAHIVTTD